MFTFKKITDTNGFDTKNLKNAKQNSYAWSMTELGDYIYVGTSRNMMSSVTSSFNSQAPMPPELITGSDNNAEIWRYKKDGTCPWQKVFKTKTRDKVFGFRAMITHKSHGCAAIYAASMGEKVSLFKSRDGLHWIKIDTSNLSGTSSRALVSLNGKLYIACLESGIGGNKPYLYAASDPEMDPFRLVINENSANFITSLNPAGGIDSLSVFNNKLYVGISTPEGAEIWRSKSSYPKNNDWTLVADKGFGDSLNMNIMSTGVFKNHLYAAVTKQLPLSLFIPLSFDLIRIDKKDKWDLVVGGKPLSPSCPSKGIRKQSLSHFNSGFNNLFNVYGWQIAQYNNNLILTTYDSSSNIKTLLTGFIYNKDFYTDKLGKYKYNELINCYKKIYRLLVRYDYPKGFDIYTSKDGLSFTPVILDGLNNPENYGGRTLYVTSENQLYLGTANPFSGLEVWTIDDKNRESCCSDDKIKYYFNHLNKMNKELLKVYPSLLNLIPEISQENV